MIMDNDDEAEATLRFVLPGACVFVCVQESAFQRALRESGNNFEHDPKHEPQSPRPALFCYALGREPSANVRGLSLDVSDPSFSLG